MATVYRTVNGRKITKVIALSREAQEAVDEKALFAAQSAEGYLLEHRHDGHSKITIEKGDVDTYVVLDDERGLKAALSIEYGREATLDPVSGEMVGGMEGLFVLTRAFHLDRIRASRAHGKFDKGGDNLRE